MTEENKETKQQTAPAPAPAQEGPDLSINDLNSLKVIIDIASSRGAFKPNEMVAVGQTYTKLAAFLEAVSKTAEGAKQNG